MPETMENISPKIATIEAITSREMQEVKAMAFMAKQFPRDEERAMAKILKACERLSLAEQATYEFPRGGEKTTGPAIRLAEVLAQNWGNVDFGIMELEQRDGESVVMAHAWDLETNTRESKVFTVPHIRATKRGSYRLTDPRDIYEIVANLGARRLRSCILGIIPGDVIDTALEKCEEILIKSIGGNLTEAVQKMFVTFEQEHAVTQKMIEKFLGYNRGAFTVKDVIKMRRIYTSIKHGMAKLADYFEDMPTEKSPTIATGNTKLDKELKTQQKQGAENASTQ